MPTGPFTRLRRGRRGAAGEELYRVRRVRGMQFFTSRQQHDDLTIVVERFPGPTQIVARTYVVVHGIGVSSRYFHPLVAELSRTGAVFLVELPGYGAAPDPRRDISLADHAAVLAGFLSEADLRAPVIVGHSMGTQVVSLLAERHPDVTDTVVMMAPTMVPSSRTLWTAIRHLLRDSLREPPRCLGHLDGRLRHPLRRAVPGAPDAAHAPRSDGRPGGVAPRSHARVQRRP